jgi:hypothetical protein
MGTRIGEVTADLDQAPSLTPDPRTPAERRASAYHEAGHAVAAHVLGLPIVGVDIVLRPDESGEASGTCLIKPWAPLSGLEGQAKQLARDQLVKHQLVLLLAGPAAQRLYAPRSRIRSSGSRDYKEAGVLAGLAGYIGARDALLHWGAIEARELVRLHSHLVESVAEALLEHKELDGDRAREIIEDAEAVMRDAASRIDLAALPPPTPKRPRALGRREIADALLRAYLARDDRPSLEAVAADIADRKGWEPSDVERRVKELVGLTPAAVLAA